MANCFVASPRVSAAGESPFASGAWNRAGFACFLVEGKSSLAAFYSEDSGGESLEVDTLNDTPKEDGDEGEYANFAIAVDINNYVNVREAAGTDSSIVGRMYKGSVAEILDVVGEDDSWLHISSGEVEGYISAQYFLYGDSAAEVIDEYTDLYACVNASRLNVRKEASLEASRMGYLDSGEKVKVLEDCGEWLKVSYTAEKTGYIAAEYVSVSEEYVTAKSMEQIRAEEAAQAALNRREHEDESTSSENTSVSYTAPNTDWTTVSELRQSIVDYAMQYLGNKYVHGGQSLEKGTDCSGFTCYIYKDFGYSISRTPGGQYSGAGRAIDMSEIQPGDIICYSTSAGKCTHVALYIGDGQIIHAANSRKGVIIGQADYSNIIGVRNVID